MALRTVLVYTQVDIFLTLGLGDFLSNYSTSIDKILHNQNIDQVHPRYKFLAFKTVY